jgi:hypothetical protein
MRGKERKNLCEIIVGITDRSFRGRSVNSRSEAVQAIALIVLCAVGIARLEHQRKGLIALKKCRQDGLRYRVGEVFLLPDIRTQRARRSVVSGRLVAWRRHS